MVLSFLVTLQLTKPERLPGYAAAALANSEVHDIRTLTAAAKAFGLKGSSNIKGDIGEIKRLDANRVSLVGWAEQIGPGRAPISVIAFVDGRSTTPIEMDGTRPDPVPSPRSSDAATDNNSFQAILSCRRGQKLLVAAITRDKDYGLLSLRLCP